MRKTIDDDDELGGITENECDSIERTKNAFQTNPGWRKSVKK
jgi:hypothetical protein